ncbi:hypothetical protein TUMSATVNIG1_00680 [Vibrio nigripulchritudo]|uniref:sulfotransferase n=1 Tax=Vibrio nigripulchritudo TaxID=28173 RepID=UPI001909A8AC|nr:sulfotransferase [Vibrio nigripulchritudo]BCL68131.1 hypothetical protein VNTUMSATTG_00680 [Vibrio nigripulchritudo]BDU29459.1 hypothetical protein TUMSATVNIG1_00680 [Vibrio nigripulchritudo]
MTAKTDLDNDVWLWFSVRWQRFVDQTRFSLQKERIATEFEQLKTCALFIGYPRSGHSIYGSILDAHPDMLVAHRLDALACVGKKPDMKKLGYLIKRNSERFAQNSRMLTGYAYDIDTGWQGKHRNLVAVADQEGKRTTLKLGENPELIETLLGQDKPMVKFIHVTRNPFDNIATWSRRMGRSLEYTTDKFLELCRYNKEIISRLPENRVVTLRHEDLIDDFDNTVGTLLDYLELEKDPHIIAKCRESVYSSPNQSRNKVNWSPDLVHRVETEIQAFDFMRHYHFGN